MKDNNDFYRNIEIKMQNLKGNSPQVVHPENYEKPDEQQPESSPLNADATETDMDDEGCRRPENSANSIRNGSDEVEEVTTLKICSEHL